MERGKIVFLPKNNAVFNLNLQSDTIIIYPESVYNTFYGPGVYKWYYVEGKEEKVIYVGRSKKDTMLRGLSEAFRLYISTDKDHQKLDTDFVVGTVIKLLVCKFGKVCFWKHIEDNPENEREVLNNQRSLLQLNSTRIDIQWKLENGENNYWKARTEDRITEAEDRIAQILSGCLSFGNR